MNRHGSIKQWRYRDTEFKWSEILSILNLKKTNIIIKWNQMWLWFQFSIPLYPDTCILYLFLCVYVETAVFSISKVKHILQFVRMWVIYPDEVTDINIIQNSQIDSGHDDIYFLLKYWKLDYWIVATCMCPI